MIDLGQLHVSAEAPLYMDVQGENIYLSTIG